MHAAIVDSPNNLGASDRRRRISAPGYRWPAGADLDECLSGVATAGDEVWPLTGRTEELQLIADVLDGDAGRAGGGVLVAGRAGVGKTRLAREASAAALKRGWVVRWVVGTAAARSVPLGAFAQWIDEPGDHPLQVVGQLIAALTASPGGAPLLVAVDDAHLLDDLSAFVVHQLVLRAAAVLVATVRAGEPAPDVVTVLWKDAHLRRLDLQPLSQAQSDDLLRAALDGPVDVGSAAHFWQLAQGNVMFLRQLVGQELAAGRLMLGENGWHWQGSMAISPSLHDVVQLHIAGAPEHVLEVLDLVVVTGTLALRYLTSVADPAAVEECEDRGLIEVSRTSPMPVVRAGHPLYVQTRLAQAGQVRLARLRGRIARAMATADSAVGPADSVRLGLLWLDSDLRPDPGVLIDAARTALTGLQVGRAVRLAEAAVAAGAGVDAELVYAQAIWLQSKTEEAEGVLAGLTAGRRAGAACSTVVNLRAANLLWSLRRPEQSWAVIDDALAAASGTVADELRAFRAVQLAAAGRPAEALAMAEAIDRGGLAALPATMSACAMTVALGDLGRPLQAAAVGEHGAAFGVTSPGSAVLVHLLGLFRVQALALGGHVSEALAVAECTDRACADLSGVGQAIAGAVAGMAALAAGDVRNAVQCLGSALAECETSEGISAYGCHIVPAFAEAIAKAGDVEAAQQALMKLHRDRHPALVCLECDNALAAAWVAAAQMRTSEAKELAARGAELARAHGQYAREVLCLQAATQFGDTRHGTRLSELACVVEGPRVGVVSRWAAALSRDNGDALAEVSDELGALGDRVAAADAAAQASLAFQRGGRRGAALTAAARAGRLISECAAITPASRAAATPALLPLTDREHEVAWLVTSGLSNKQIAGSLCVSPRTAEGHIYHACAKLGVANRTELASLLGEFTPAKPAAAPRDNHAGCAAGLGAPRGSAAASNAKDHGKSCPVLRPGGSHL